MQMCYPTPFAFETPDDTKALVKINRKVGVDAHTAGVPGFSA
jgi:hypothetical protein